ncbi:MAG TPA: hypothetical protein LFW21_02825 [Rickettsia endosymbiont of Pyrocoelia pectoralis]|nr:hypothetical protein [Rickettsia endosymbiont of Pyrocoelia pectoralis]
MQKLFQPNTTTKQIYSYFTLGKFIVQYNKLCAIKPLALSLRDIITQELNHT